MKSWAMKSEARSVLGPSLVLALWCPLAALASAQDSNTAPATPDPGTSADAAAVADVPSQEPRIIFPAPSESPPPAEPPAPAAEPFDFIVLSTVQNVIPSEGRSIIVHRVAPPDIEIPDPPPPAPEIADPSPEFLALLETLRQNRLRYKTAGFSVTVWDHQVSQIRWWRRKQAAEDPPASPRPPRMRVTSGQPALPALDEFEAWSNIDWNCLRSASAVEADGIRYDLLLGIGDIDTAKSGRLGPHSIPDHPQLPATPATFVLTKGDPADADATACLRAIHAAYPAQAEELWAVHAARERLQREHEAWLKANPPQPQDTVIHCWKATKEQAAEIRKLVP